MALGIFEILILGTINLKRGHSRRQNVKVTLCLPHLGRVDHFRLRRNKVPADVQATPRLLRVSRARY